MDTRDKTKCGFETWFNKRYPLPATVERGPIGRDLKNGCEEAYMAGYTVPRAELKAAEEKATALEKIINMAGGSPPSATLKFTDYLLPLRAENKRLEDIRKLFKIMYPKEYSMVQNTIKVIGESQTF